MVVEEAHFEHPMTQDMNAAEEYLQAAFPPGMRSMLIPNVIVTTEDVMDVAEAEATEDFHSGAAVKPLKRSYWDYGPMR